MAKVFKEEQEQCSIISTYYAIEKSANLEPDQDLAIYNDDKVRLTKYYGHGPMILHMINGKKPVHLSEETLAEIRLLFLKSERSFVNMKDKKRHNYLSYGFIIHKLI